MEQVIETSGGCVAPARTLAIVTIGQAPRTDLTGDIMPLLPANVTVREYGALDEMTFEQVMGAYDPAPGDEVLVSRMRDGRQVRFTDRFVIPLVQTRIAAAEAEGADATMLLCTGAFPQFEHARPLLEPQTLFHQVACALAGKAPVGLLVPDPAQLEQAAQRWEADGVRVVAACASPYQGFDAVVEAGRGLADRGLALLCCDCMGYTVAMKHALEQASGLPVLLPRTIMARILADVLS